MTDAGPLVVHNCILGLGYGMGWVKFCLQIVKDARLQLGKEITMPDEEGQRIVNVYRRTYPAIVRMWKRLNDSIPFMLDPDCHIEIGPVILKHKHILLPSGLKIHYHDLRYETKDGKGEWWYTYGVKKKRLYGAKMLENIIQSLARICTFDAAVRIRRRFERLDDSGAMGLALQAHDELVYVIPEDIADVCQAIVLEEMRVRPAWAPELPLDAEAGYGPTYGDTK
jgi:DNA polymerase